MQAPLSARVRDEDTTNTTAGAEASEGRPELGTFLFADHPRTPRHEAESKATIILRTHDGGSYVLPYLPLEATKLQIEQIYKLRGREKLAKAIQSDNFSLLNENGDIILPQFWNSVISPFASVQVSLPPDVLDLDIASFYPAEDRPGMRRRLPSSSPIRSTVSATRPIAEDPGTVSEETGNDSSGSEIASDAGASSSGSELSEARPVTEASVEINRLVRAPVDGEGNSLSFQVNTTFVRPQDRVTANGGTLLNKREPQSIGNTEYLSIAKAVPTTQAEGRNTLQLHVLPGPRSGSMQSDVSVRWYHLHSERLDFVGFKELCLSIPDISERLQKLTRKLFERIESDKLKASLDGMFIEPGTVLRADESHQSDPQSVIFSCLPYFELQTPAKQQFAGRTDRLFPIRTLMQSYYPYEPVRERDAEQAYRKFGNERVNALVHVPNLWMVNLGPGIVITCGHQALSKDFVQSMEVIQVDRNLSTEKNAFTSTVRLTDWSGRKLLYSRDECRTYFQMEQKLRELRQRPIPRIAEGGLQLFWQISNSRVKVTPGLWAGIIGERDTLFVDLEVSDSLKRDNKDTASAVPSPSAALSPIPFFHWPQNSSTDETETDGLKSACLKQPMQCLEHVEKTMLSAVLSRFGAYNAVEKTFTSTAYYRALPEASEEQAKTSIGSMATIDKLTRSRANPITTHQALVYRQHDAIAQRASQLYSHMRGAFALFVTDVDESVMLRKSWAALSSLGETAATVCKRSPLASDPDEYTNADSKQPSTSHQGWFVRPDFSDTNVIDSAEKLKRTFEKCRKCRTSEMYSTPQAAMKHLQKHLKQIDSSEVGILTPEEWIVNYAQKKLETWNEGHVAILTTACDVAKRISTYARELSEGVCTEDGQMSDLYTFPRSLLSAFRQLLVFYFAVERAIYYTNESFQDTTKNLEDPDDMTSLPFSSSGLQVIEAFGNGVQQALISARIELCSMVKSTHPSDDFKRLSMGSEYVCSWFFRRLIVKPLEKRMTVSDMYREYLSTIQFQVNHRPGKRLLRSINLLQEELTALREVNTQQMKLITDYMSVLDNFTYEKGIPSRSAMYLYERMLLASCLDNLQLTDQEYRYLLARCGPLSDSTKQSLEINEEDHGKAIMVFTIVTIIFLPLSFVTSFLGMNTTDIRDMGSSSSLFWSIAVPLTAVTMGSILYIGYNGDELRNKSSSLYRAITGKQDRSTSARGISVAQRKRARKLVADSNTTLDFTSLADEAEFANPRPYNHYRIPYEPGEPYNDDDDLHRPQRRQHTLEPPTMEWEPYASAPVPEPRTNLRTQHYMPRTGIPITQIKVFNERKEVINMPTSFEPAGRRASHAPPPPLISRPSPWDRRISVQDYGMDEPMRRHIPRPRGYQQPERAPAPYEWTKKSHRHHRSDRQEPRRRRNDRYNAWNEPDDEGWDYFR